MQEPGSSPPDRLESWKEIAAYLKRDVRTVQRWEKQENLPVYRHHHLKLGTVYAYKAELDVWWRNGHEQLDRHEQLLAAVRARRRPWLVAVPLAAVAVLGIVLASNWGGWTSRFFGDAPRVESIAVLPLENLSGDPEQDYFADGVTDTLITDLAKIGSLRVISRTSAMRYKAAKKPLAEIARELKVDAVVEGTVVRAGDRVRINVQLIHAASDEHLWAESYEGGLSDVLALQNDAARAIASAVRAELTPAERARFARPRPLDPEAQRAYLLGRFFWNKRTAEGMRNAIEQFNLAVQKDPNFAAAYAGLSDAYNLLEVYEDGPPGRFVPQAKAAALQALALDDTLADAHASLASILFSYEWDADGAEKEFRRALEMNPNYATGRHWYGLFLLTQGRFEAARHQFFEAAALDPLSVTINTAAANNDYHAGHYERAVEGFRRSVEMDPHHAGMRVHLGLALVQAGRHEQAIAELQRASEMIEDYSDAIASLAYAYAVAGRVTEAKAEQARLQALSRRSYVTPYLHAVVHAGLGEKEQAFRALDAAYRERSRLMMYVKVDPRLAALRAVPRFAELLHRLHLAS